MEAGGVVGTIPYESMCCYVSLAQEWHACNCSTPKVV